MKHGQRHMFSLHLFKERKLRSTLMLYSLTFFFFLFILNTLLQVSFFFSLYQVEKLLYLPNKTCVHKYHKVFFILTDSIIKTKKKKRHSNPETHFSILHHFLFLTSFPCLRAAAFLRGMKCSRIRDASFCLAKLYVTNQTIESWTDGRDQGEEQGGNKA